MDDLGDIREVAILVDTATGWGRRLIRGVLDYGLQHGPWHTWVEARSRHDATQLPRGWAGDGVIARVASPQVAQQLNGLNVPVINVSGVLVPGVDFPRVTVDYEAAARMAYQHFQVRGFRYFGYVGPSGLAYVRRHQHAFETVLEEHGHTCEVYRPRRSRSGPAGWKDRIDHLVTWLEALPKPIGIFSWATEKGREVVEACHWGNIPIPHDVAVLGGDYDDLLDEAVNPNLSGVLVPAQQIGAQAAAMLDALMHGRELTERERFIAPDRVIEQRSTDTLAVHDRKLAGALQFIRDHACEPIQVEDILRNVPMDRRSLERKFKAVLGRTPIEEIRRFRINHARTLLAETDLPMQEIAESCGYANYNYLTYVFKKDTGMSPSAYRTQVRGG